MMNHYQLLLIPYENSIKPDGILSKKYKLNSIDYPFVLSTAQPFPKVSREKLYLPLFVYNGLNNSNVFANHNHYIFKIMEMLGNKGDIGLLFKRIPSFVINHFLYENSEPLSGSKLFIFKPFAYTYFQGHYHFLNHQYWFSYCEKTRKIEKKALGLPFASGLSACVESKIVATCDHHCLYILDGQKLYQLPKANMTNLSVKKGKNGAIRISYNIKSLKYYPFSRLKYESLQIENHRGFRLFISDNIAHYYNRWESMSEDKKIHCQIETVLIDKNYNIFLKGWISYLGSFLRKERFCSLYLILPYTDNQSDIYSSLDAFVQRFLDETFMLSLSPDLFRDKPYYKFVKGNDL